MIAICCPQQDPFQGPRLLAPNGHVRIDAGLVHHQLQHSIQAALLSLSAAIVSRQAVLIDLALRPHDRHLRPQIFFELGGPGLLLWQEHRPRILCWPTTCVASCIQNPICCLAQSRSNHQPILDSCWLRYSLEAPECILLPPLRSTVGPQAPCSQRIKAHGCWFVGPPVLPPNTDRHWLSSKATS